MTVARIPIESVPTDQLAALSRATRWRAEKRGWITRDYHVRFANVRVFSDPAFAEEATPIYKQAQRCVAYALGANWPFPAHLDQDDLVQECVIELWRCSGKAGFSSEGWRAAVMLNHLRRLRQGCRFDRDRFNLEKSDER